MNTPMSRPFRIRNTTRHSIEAMPIRPPQMATFATSAGACGANDTPFDRPGRRELRGRYASNATPPALFRVHH